MAENTKIQWATHSFSPWIGCAQVHEGCRHCYAEAMSRRLGVVWGLNGTRRRTAYSTWKKVESWNRGEEPFIHWANYERPRIFPSLCDPFEDRPDVVLWRQEFFRMIDRCPNLDFLLLTKRPENINRMWPNTRLPSVCSDGTSSPGEFYRRNVWLLYSASDQATLEAGLPHLVRCRDLVPVLGLSLEPLIGPIDLHMTGCLGTYRLAASAVIRLMPSGQTMPDPRAGGIGRHDGARVQWLIVGGESGPHARYCDIGWIRSIVSQCREASVPCFVKQLGAAAARVELRDLKGGDPQEWPEDLRVREQPIPSRR